MLRDEGSGGGGGGAEPDDEEIEAQPPDDPVRRVSEEESTLLPPTDWDESEGAGGGSVEATVAHPGFLKPGVPSLAGGRTTGVAILVLASTMDLGILTPAALAALLSSFSSLFLSFSCLSSATFASAPVKPTPLAFAAMSFIRAL